MQRLIDLRKFLFILVLPLVVLGIWFGPVVFREKENFKTIPNAPGAVLGTSSVPEVQPGPKSVSHSQISRTALREASRMKELWGVFQAGYGPFDENTFSPDLRLLRLRSDQSIAAGGGFQSGQRNSVLARGEEIVKNAQELLGLDSFRSLSLASIQTDEFSSQLEWIQTVQGLPIEPAGRLSLQLTQEGGLRGLYSSIIADYRISNQVSMSMVEARQLVFSSLQFHLEHPEKVNDLGHLILFAKNFQQSSTQVELRHAYRFWIEGREIIVDADNGQLLSEKDRRQS